MLWPLFNALKYHTETLLHYCDVMMSVVAFQITNVSIVCSIVGSDADQRKHQSSVCAYLFAHTFLWVIHRWPVNSPNKRPVTRKMFPIWWRHRGTEYKWQGHRTVNTFIPYGTKWMNAPQLTCTNGIHAFLFLNWKDKSGFTVTCNIWCTPTVWNYVWQ